MRGVSRFVVTSPTHWLDIKFSSQRTSGPFDFCTICFQASSFSSYHMIVWSGSHHNIWAFSVDIFVLGPRRLSNYVILDFHGERFFETVPHKRLVRTFHKGCLKSPFTQVSKIDLIVQQLQRHDPPTKPKLISNTKKLSNTMKPHNKNKTTRTFHSPILLFISIGIWHPHYFLFFVFFYTLTFILDLYLYAAGSFANNLFHPFANTIIIELYFLPSPDSLRKHLYIHSQLHPIYHYHYQNYHSNQSESTLRGTGAKTY